MCVGRGRGVWRSEGERMEGRKGLMGDSNGGL